MQKPRRLNSVGVIAAMAMAAAGSRVVDTGVGFTSPRLPRYATKNRTPPTQADFDALAKAQAKRERKAAKLRGNK